MNSGKDKLAYAAVYGTILGFYDITDIPINTVAVTKDDKKYTPLHTILNRKSSFSIYLLSHLQKVF